MTTAEERARFNATFIPGTEVLRNKLKLTSARELQRWEYLLTNQQLETLPDIETSFEGFKAVHHHLFHGIYDWAGSVREYPLAKREVEFADYRTIETRGADAFSDPGLRRETKDPSQFGYRAAKLTGTLNQLHPFREGNGRTMKAFLSKWSETQGHQMNFNRWGRAEWVQSSIEARRGNLAPMADLIGTKLRRQVQRERGQQRQLNRTEVGRDVGR